jgi:hypothetical protein
MNHRHTTIIILFLALCVMVPYGYAANTLLANPSTVSLNQGSTQTAKITVDELPYGLSGYSIRVSLADPSMGKIVSVHYPQWAVINTTDGLQSASVTMSAVDLTKQIEAGAKSVELGSITISGVSTGNTNILITKLIFDGDGEAGVDMGRNTVQTTQPTTTAAISATGTTGSTSYSSGGSSGGSSGSSSVSSGSTGSGGSATTTLAKATTVPSGTGGVSPQATAATHVQGSPAERVTVNAVTTAVVPSPAIPVTSGGIPGWALTGIGIIAVLAALGLIYLTYKKKL